MAFPEAWASVTSAAEWRNERLCMKIPERFALRRVAL
jgi:hypothetical protein